MAAELLSLLHFCVEENIHTCLVCWCVIPWFVHTHMFDLKRVAHWALQAASLSRVKATSNTHNRLEDRVSAKTHLMLPSPQGASPLLISSRNRRKKLHIGGCALYSSTVLDTRSSTWDYRWSPRIMTAGQLQELVFSNYVLVLLSKKISAHDNLNNVIKAASQFICN